MINKKILSYFLFFMTFCFQAWGAVVVSTVEDIDDAPDKTSVAALLADPGPDNKISLREAIVAINNDTTETTINFDVNIFSITSPGRIQINSRLSVDGEGTMIDASSRGVIIDGTNLTGSTA